MGAHPGVKRDPPPAEPMGVDQRVHVADNLRLRQRLDDEPAFPGLIMPAFPMLDRAAAAGSEMLAERRDAFRAGALDLKQTPSVGMVTRHRGHLDGLPAKRVRHIERLSVGEGDAVAEMADMIDDEAFNHGARR